MNAAEVDVLAGRFAGAGSRRYLGEAVSVADHQLQCASLAAAAGMGEVLQLAALLHDVGYLLEPPRAKPHERAAAAYLAGHLPPEVVAPIALHVEAKRYLCAAEAGYGARLSAASRASLARQGGPLDAAGAADFLASPHADEAVALRRLDDQAKVPGLVVAPFEAYRELLARA